ncbi:hypothetical protein [uncultured Faecalibaculum sp.]|uniref:hypothetical protein n=1 Tax=uncultured Faecalibaculum sp. TaxID=1729681 RepID=UPI0025CC0669|nr:hypothetical protein [uncultured Faecalibaculum sp.]
MKRKDRKTRDPFRKTGCITFEESPVEIWLNARTGQMQFRQQGREVTDMDLHERILTYLKEANRE